MRKFKGPKRRRYKLNNKTCRSIKSGINNTKIRSLQGKTRKHITVKKDDEHQSKRTFINSYKC